MSTENPAIANAAAATNGGSGFWSAITGLITKGADTYVELQTINGANAKPTNTTAVQTNPAAAGGAAAAQVINWKPILIGAGIFVGGVVTLLIIAKAVKSA